MSAADLGAMLADLLKPIVAEAVKDALAEIGNEGPPALLDRSALARQLACSTRHVDHLRADGLPVVMVGDSPRFEIEAVLGWLRARTGGSR